jgi:hypothetical protein
MSDTSAMSSLYDGGCTCRQVRYRMTTKPLFVHCCHCSWCQRETGSAFALNAMIEADRVQLLAGDVVIVDTPSHSGKGQRNPKLFRSAAAPSWIVCRKTSPPTPRAMLC